jgi:AraC-like DNA-binding protein
MRYFESIPEGPLADFVQCFWYLEKDYGGSNPAGEWIFPDGTTDLVIQRTGQFSIGFDPLPVGFFVGPRRTPLLLRCQGRAAAIGVRFHPHGPYPLFRKPLDHFREKVVPLIALMGQDSGEIEQQVQSTTPWAALDCLKKFLLDRVPVEHGESARMRTCVQWLRQTLGAAPISALSAHVKLSTRQLERRFRLTTGFTPKQLARIYRFDAVRDRLMLQPGIDLTALAHTAQYHDQAHFIHDFRDLAGLAPTGFAREVAEGAIRFNT